MPSLQSDDAQIDDVKVSASGERGRPRMANRTLHPAGWPSAKGYANGMAGEGIIVVTGGVVGWDVEGRFPNGFVAQARQTFSNIIDILAEAGAGPEHVVRLTWYVTDMDAYLADLKGLGHAYRAVFDRNFPSMTAVQVVRLVEPEAMIEIEAMAVVPHREQR